MSGNRQQTLVVARQLLRTFGSAPDPRRRAQAVMSELKLAEDWPTAGRRALDAADFWVRNHPPLSALEPRLRNLLLQLAKD
jgi:hypothetical protein